jgi:alpha-D-ribose 1-methylphosphonate 5-triphosphate synthase subunit PhnI
VPLDTTRMLAERRISSTFKDVPGGQVLGPTYDYTHRLLDFSLAAAGERPEAPTAPVAAAPCLPRVGDILEREGMLEPPPASVGDNAQDITRTPLVLPADRPVRLQNLARGDEGFLLALGYSTQRGYGNNHPFVGEIRYGHVPVAFVPEELGFEIEIAEIEVTECDMVNQFAGAHDIPPQFTRGYGLAFGHAERKAMAMALVDRALRAGELSENATAPAQDEEFVLSHSDNVEASGFVQHLKLPHYVDFQSELVVVRALRAEVEMRNRQTVLDQAAE